jgi:hypothetical protein
MVKLAHRDKTRVPIQIGVGTNIGVPTQTSQGNLILGKVDLTVKGFLGIEKNYCSAFIFSGPGLGVESIANSCHRRWSPAFWNYLVPGRAHQQC